MTPGSSTALNIGYGSRSGGIGRFTRQNGLNVDLVQKYGFSGASEGEGVPAQAVLAERREAGYRRLGGGRVTAGPQAAEEGEVERAEQGGEPLEADVVHFDVAPHVDHLREVQDHL